jgi:hypothetical protein
MTDEWVTLIAALSGSVGLSACLRQLIRSVAETRRLRWARRLIDDHGTGVIKDLPPLARELRDGPVPDPRPDTGKATGDGGPAAAPEQKEQKEQKEQEEE